MYKKVFSISALLLFLFVSSCSSREDGNNENKDIVTNEKAKLELASIWISDIGEVVKRTFVYNDYIYASAGYEGILIFSLDKDIINKKYITNIIINNYPVRDIKVVEKDSRLFMFVALGEYKGKGGIAVYDVSDLNNIKALLIDSTIENADLNTLDVSPNDFSITASSYGSTFQKYKYDIDRNDLVVIDKGFDKDIEGLDFAVKGDYMFTACGTNGLNLIKTDKVSYIVANITNSLSSVNSVSFFGNNENVLILADKMCCLAFYDISVIEKPKLLRYFDVAGDAYWLEVIGDDIYLADGINGVLLIDALTKKDIEIKTVYQGSFVCYHIYPYKNYLVLSCGVNGIFILDRV